MRKLIILTFLLYLTACDTNPVKELSSLRNSSEPSLITGQDGKVYLTWIEERSDTAFLNISNLEKQTWIEKETITGGTNWFLNWADFPSVAVNSESDIRGNYLQKSGKDTYAYDVIVKTKANGEWQPPNRPHNDNTQTEHGFVSMVPVNSGLFFMTWLDGRNTLNEDDATNSMSIRGAYINNYGDILSQNELDSRVCDCCQTSVAMSGDGPIVVYRDRSFDEVRDISLIKWKDSKWEKSKIIYEDNWKIEGCPVNGPKIASNGNNAAVAWFTAANSSPQVKVILSDDKAESFLDPIRIDNGNPIGRVDVEILSEGSAIVSWMEEVDGNAEIRARKVGFNGELGKNIVISKTSLERASGFPQITLQGNRLIVAWTDVSDGVPEIRTAWVRINQF